MYACMYVCMYVCMQRVVCEVDLSFNDNVHSQTVPPRDRILVNVRFDVPLQERLSCH